MANPQYDAVLGQYADSGRDLLRLADGSVISYGAMADKAARFAGVLAASGVTKGDRVAMQVAKSVDALALYLACLRSGAVFVPLNTAYTPGEVAYFVNDAAPAVLICDPGAEGKLTSVAAGAGADILTLDATGGGSLTRQAEEVAPAGQVVDCSEDDLACFLYTSGTTGRSKGAMLTQGNLVSNARTLATCWRFTDKDVLLHALPIFHAHGLFVACNVVMLTGGAMIWLPGFDTDDVLEALPGATAMMGVPTFYTRLLADARFDRDRAGHMRLFTSGSAPLLAETHVAFQQRTGHAILERYGMTETGMNTSNPYDGARRAGTVGPALPDVEVRITDPATGETLAQGATGMIEVRGPNVFKGYWQMPEKTAEELRPNGFLITGDLGMIDADGYVTIVGRQKDLIISGGYNVYPKEVELVLDTHGDVRESAVIGVPHPDFGEGVVAIVVAATDAPDSDGIMASAAQNLAKYKLPKRIMFLDELPRNTMGKVQKNVLRDRFATLFQS